MSKLPLVAMLSLFICVPAVNADVTDNKRIVQSALTEVIAERKVDAVDRYFTESYIQHNAMMPSGSAPIKKFLSKPIDPDAPTPPPNVTHRIIGEGDLVATHSTYYNFGPKPLVAFDVFRVEDGRIAEHWDNLIPLEEKPNPSGRTQVDGATDITDLDKTAANKAHVVDMVQRMFIDRERIKPTEFISTETYLQHNPAAGDGLKGLQKLMKENRAKGIKMAYERIGLVVAEGNFVLTAVEGRINETPTAFYDLWRLEDGLIVEHWDVISPIQTAKLPPNYPGKF